MIEILVVIGLCRKIGSVMRAKGRKPGGLQALAVVAWFGTEALFGVLWGMSGWEMSPMLYIGAILAGAMGGVSVLMYANSLDPLGDAPIQGGRECPECGEHATADDSECPVCGADLEPRRPQRSQRELDSFAD